ncbi:MAG: hypothetical protein WD200_03940 [Candidatus Andersenbacteria bacterium]
MAQEIAQIGNQSTITGNEQNWGFPTPAPRHQPEEGPKENEAKILQPAQAAAGEQSILENLV